MQSSSEIASYLALLELSIEQRKIMAAFYSPYANVPEENKARLTPTPESLKYSKRPRRNALKRMVAYQVVSRGL